MSVRIISKFDEDLIKAEVLSSGQHLPIMCLKETKRQVTHVNSLICLKIELVPDLTAVIITCKSDEYSIKDEIALSGQHFPKSMGPSRDGNYHANSRY